MPEGDVFERAWFAIAIAAPFDAERVRAWAWDRTGTEGGAGVLMAKGVYGVCYVEDVIRGRGQWSSRARNKIIKQTAQLDAERFGRRLRIMVEQEPGSGGKESAEHTIEQLAGFDVRAHRLTGGKVMRAEPMSASAEGGNVRLVRGAWVPEFLEALCSFPGGTHDDQVDAAALAFSTLVTGSTQ